MVFKPAEESIDCGEYLGAIPEPFWRDGYIFYPARQINHRFQIFVYDSYIYYNE